MSTEMTSQELDALERDTFGDAQLEWISAETSTESRRHENLIMRMVHDISRVFEQARQATDGRHERPSPRRASLRAPSRYNTTRL
jgi:hypothetical protein